MHYFIPKNVVLAGILLALPIYPVGAQPCVEDLHHETCGALAVPAGAVVLTVKGKIHRSNSSQGAEIDMATLERLPLHSLLTSTAVTDGVSRFDGYLVRDLLELVDAHGSIAQAQALNNYSVDIPVSDFYQYDVLLATHMNGLQLEPTGKGPLWIVYPRDDWRQLQDIRYDYRWVWQLNRLTLK